jgi:hypothetical protein
MKFLVQKTVYGLQPVFNSDYEKLKESKLKMGEVYEVEIKKKRNYEFHKKFFALINLCHENQDIFDYYDDTREYLTIKAGYYRKIMMPNGNIQVRAKSISFATMDEIEFEELYQRVITAACNFIGIEKEDLLNEILNFC